MPSTRPESVLRDPEFVRYLVGRVLSGGGTIVTLIALPILVYRISDSPSLTALVAACEAAPYFVFGLVAGALADRWNRKRVMVTADLLSCLLILSLPVAHWFGEVTVPHVMLVAFLGPTIGVFFDGAVFGALPMLVGRPRIAEANSIAWGAQNVIEIVLPSIVGLSLAVMHPSTLLLLDALSFVASAALVASLTRPLYDESRVRPPFGLRQIGRDIAEGLRFLWGHGGVRTMTFVGLAQCLAGGAFVALMVVWIDRQLDAGTEGLRFGMVYGSWAVGGLAAAALLPAVLRRTTPARVTLAVLPFSAALGFFVPTIGVWWVAGIGLAAWSVAYTMVMINSISYRQLVTPEPLLGRVNTAGRMLSWGVGWTGGALLAGVLVVPLGIVPTMQLLALAPVLAVVVAWTSPLRSGHARAEVAAT